MNTPLQLINGTFAPSDASQILRSLVKSKIDFHTREKHSNRERHGKDADHSGKRLKELAELQKHIQQLISSANAAGQSLQIKGWIEITPVARIASQQTPTLAAY